MASYFHHLKDKKNVLTVIGSGGQILNSVLAGTKNLDCFDISIFPEYYLHLQIASILALSKEEYLKYYFSNDREELFGDCFYDKISEKLKGKYKEFWDTLYMFDDGYDIYESPLFRYDVCLKNHVVNMNPYLQDNNYEKLKHILQTDNIKINTMVANVIKTKFPKEYDLVNLSNIIPYCFSGSDLKSCIEFFRDNFSLTQTGEIINYMFSLQPEYEEEFKKLLEPNGYVEDIKNKKLLVYKK